MACVQGGNDLPKAPQQRFSVLTLAGTGRKASSGRRRVSTHSSQMTAANLQQPQAAATQARPRLALRVTGAPTRCGPQRMLQRATWEASGWTQTCCGGRRGGDDAQDSKPPRKLKTNLSLMGRAAGLLNLGGGFNAKEAKETTCAMAAWGVATSAS